MLPDFLGIGAQRAGTTWLYENLKAHPQICMPEQKELHFFDRYFERGEEWYRSNFKKCNAESQKGEITPKYLYDPKVPQKISGLIPNAKLIIILRNPIERAYSQFKLSVRDYNYQENFTKFLKEKSNAKERGLYFQQISRYLNYFSRKQIKIILFEEMMENPKENLQDVSQFLEVDPSFDPSNLKQSVNSSQKPQLPFIYAFGKKFASKLHDADASWLVNYLKKTGIKKLLLSKQKKDDFPPLTGGVEKHLKDYYKEDVSKLSDLLNRNLFDFWNIK